MGLLSWLRSHRSGVDTAPAPAPATDTAGPAGPDHGSPPSAPPMPPAPVAAWRSLPPIQRTTTPPTLVTDPTGFRAGLHDQRGTAVTGQLGHLVSPQAPSGLVHGLITSTTPSVPASTVEGPQASMQRFERSARPGSRPEILAGQGSTPAAAPPSVALQRLEATPLTHAAPVDTGSPPLPIAEPAEPTELRVTAPDPADLLSDTTGSTGSSTSTESTGSVSAVPVDLAAGRTVTVPTASPEQATPPTVQTTPSTAPATESPAAPPVRGAPASPLTGSGGRGPRQGLGAPLTDLPPTAATVQRVLAGTTATPHPQPAPPDPLPQPQPQPQPQPPAQATESVVPAQLPRGVDELTVVPLSFQRMTQFDLPTAQTAQTAPAEPAPPTAAEADSGYSVGMSETAPATLEPPAGDLPLQRLEVATGPSAPVSPAVAPPTGVASTDATPGDARPAPGHWTVPPTAPLLGATTPPVPSDPAPDRSSGSVHASDPDAADPGVPIQRATVDHPPPDRAAPAPDPVDPPLVVPLLAQRGVELLAAPAPVPAPTSDPAPAGATAASATTRPHGLPSTGPDLAPEAPAARLRWESPADSLPDPTLVPSGTVQRSAAPGSGGRTTPAWVTPAPPRRTSAVPSAPDLGPVDAGAVAVAAGIAQRMVDGSVVFGPPGTVQRAPEDATTPPPEPATPQPPADTPPTTPPEAGSAAAGEPPVPGGTDQAHPAGGAATPTVTDELVRSLFGPLSRLLKAELRLERERAGRLIDTRH